MKKERLLSQKHRHLAVTVVFAAVHHLTRRRIERTALHSMQACWRLAVRLAAAHTDALCESLAAAVGDHVGERPGPPLYGHQ